MLGVRAPSRTATADRRRFLSKEEELASYGVAWEEDSAHQRLLAEQLATARRRRWSAWARRIWQAPAVGVGRER
ncbi:MAG: hypothetical protein M3Q65_24095 [Chloroflexota bacterium]|nr:hypothetical protein [Chloroflexota bacterium]